MANGEYKIKTALDTSGLKKGFSEAETLAKDFADESKGQLRTLSTEAGKTGDAVAAGLLKGGEGVNKLNGLFRDANGVIRNAKGEFASLKDVAGTSLEGVTDEAKKLFDEIKALGQLKTIDFGLERNSAEFEAGLIKAKDYRQELKQHEKQLKDLIPTLDRTTDEYKQAASQLATVKGALKEVNAQLDRAQQIGSGLKNVGGALSLGVTAPLLAAGTAAVKLSSDAEEIGSKFETVFKENTADAEAFAEALGRNVGRAQTDLKGYLATLQDTFVPLGFARDQASDLSQELVALAIDVASFNNQADADTLADFQSALVGNTETVRKYGVVITEATTTQKALELGLAKTKNEISEQDKVYARYIQILEGTSDAQGDATRTADSAANSYKAFRAALSDAAVEFGENLLPTLTDGLQSVTKMVRGFSELDERTQDLIIRGALLAGALGPVALALGNVLTTASSMTVALTALGTSWAALGTRILPFLGPAGLLLGAAAAGYVLNDYLQGNQEIVKQSGESFDTLRGKLKSYREGLEITSEAERTSAINSLETQKSKIEKLIAINESYAKSQFAFAETFNEMGIVDQIFNIGNLNTSLDLAEQATQQVDALKADLKAVDTQIAEVREFKIEVTSPDGGSEDDPFKGVSSSLEDVGEAAETAAEKQERLNAALKEGQALRVQELGKNIASDRLDTAEEQQKYTESLELRTGERSSIPVPQVQVETRTPTEANIFMGQLERGELNGGLTRNEKNAYTEYYESRIESDEQALELATARSEQLYEATATEQERQLNLLAFKIGTGVKNFVLDIVEKSQEGQAAIDAAKSRQEIVKNFSGASTIDQAPVAAQIGAGLNPLGANADLSSEVRTSQKLQAEAMAKANRETQDFSSTLAGLNAVSATAMEVQQRAAEATLQLAVNTEKAANAQTLSGFVSDQRFGSSEAQQQFTESLLLRGLPNAGAGLSNEEVLKGLRGQGLSDDLINEGVTVLVDGLETGLVDAVDIQKKGADEFASTVIQAAGQAGQLLIGVLSGKTSAGGFIAGAGAIAGAFVPGPVGTAISVGSSLVGGLVDFFTGGNNDAEEQRRREKEQSRSVPAINIKAEVNQYNSFDANLTDARVQSALYQQTRTIVGEVLQQTGVMDLVKESREP